MRMIPLLPQLGVNARWDIINGNDKFFAITKKLHFLSFAADRSCYPLHLMARQPGADILANSASGTGRTGAPAHRVEKFYQGWIRKKIAPFIRESLRRSYEQHWRCYIQPFLGEKELDRNPKS